MNIIEKMGATLFAIVGSTTLLAAGNSWENASGIYSVQSETCLGYSNVEELEIVSSEVKGTLNVLVHRMGDGEISFFPYVGANILFFRNIDQGRVLINEGDADGGKYIGSINTTFDSFNYKLSSQENGTYFILGFVPIRFINEKKEISMSSDKLILSDGNSTGAHCEITAIY